MKLSAAILAHRLKQNFPYQTGRQPETVLELEQVLFYSQDSRFLPNKVYITFAEDHPDLADIPKSTLVLLIGDISANDLKDSNVFVFDKSTNAYALFNAVQKAFDFYERWEQKLRDLSEDGKIQEMLDESFRLFRNPMIVASADYFVIAYSSIIDQKNELSSLVDPDAIFEYTKEYKEGGAEDDFNQRRGAFIFPGYITGSRSFCVNLFENGKYAYRLTLVEELVRLEDYEGALLELLALHLQKALTKQLFMRSERVYRPDRILMDLLMQEQGDPKITEQMMQEFGWMPDQEYFCLTLKVASQDLQDMTDRFISSHIEKLLPHSCAFPFRQNIAVFVNLTRFGGNIDEAMERIVYFLRDSFIKSGISNSFTGFDKVYEYYQQALIAIGVGSRKFPFRWMHRFEDVALEYMMECCIGELPVELVCAREIRMLKAYDNEHHTDYYRTLEVYIKAQLNAVQAAKQLYIHRSTFLYRMEKIKELIHMNLEDFDTLLYAMITFKILEKEDTTE